MKISELTINQVDELLELEEKMYWENDKWGDLWKQEAKEKFRNFITEYLNNFPKGCFGLVDERDNLLGAFFILKTSQITPIPYLHTPSNYYSEKGNVAYVSFFVVRRGQNEDEIAQKLYDNAEEVALLKLRCKHIAVLIYSSPLEENILIGNNYEKQPQQYEWEIYPGKRVKSWIYVSSLLMEQTLIS